MGGSSLYPRGERAGEPRPSKDTRCGLAQFLKNKTNCSLGYFLLEFVETMELYLTFKLSIHLSVGGV